MCFLPSADRENVAVTYVLSMGLNTYLLKIKIITVAACQFLKVAVLHILLCSPT